MIRIISALMCLSIAIVFTAYVCCRDRRAIEQWCDDFFKNLNNFFKIVICGVILCIIIALVKSLVNHP